MSRFLASAIFISTVLFFPGCAGKSLGPISAETLIGRWRAVTKEDADEGNASRDARGVTGETIAFRYEFKADHTFEMSVQIKGGLQPNAALVLQTMAAQLRAQHHLGEVSTYTKSYFGTPVEEDRAQEIAQSCDAVIAGVGD